MKKEQIWPLNTCIYLLCCNNGICTRAHITNSQKGRNFFLDFRTLRCYWCLHFFLVFSRSVSSHLTSSSILYSIVTAFLHNTYFFSFSRCRWFHCNLIIFLRTRKCLFFSFQFVYNSCAILFILLLSFCFNFHCFDRCYFTWFYLIQCDLMRWWFFFWFCCSSFRLFLQIFGKNWEMHFT